MTTEPLAVLIGRWVSSGRTVARPGEPAVEIEGTDVYEWGPGRYVLVHRVDVRMGGEQVDVLEIIGPADAVGGYPMRAYDQAGGVVTMHATVDDAGVWTFAGETERATLTVAPDGSSMDAVWERSADGGNSWEHWMDMHFRRAEPVPTPREVAVSFIEAFGRGDRSSLAGLLDDNVIFESPQVRLTGAPDVLDAISGFAEVVTGVQIHAVLGDDEQAMIAYDMATKPFGTLRAVDHLVVRDGRIISDVLVFDTYEVRRAMEAQASPVDSRT
jgi:hypothetical protein